MDFSLLNRRFLAGNKEYSGEFHIIRIFFHKDKILKIILFRQREIPEFQLAK